MSEARTVAVITGGAGGMGLATAKIMGTNHRLLLSDVSDDRLDAAVAELRAAGVDADATRCDVTDGDSVRALVERARSLGEVVAVVHTAGVSPQMGGPEMMLRINALGTVAVTAAFLAGAAPGFRIVNVASMSAYMSPRAAMPRGTYKYALTDPERFVSKVMRRLRITGEEQRSGFAYAISKNFVVWHAKKMASEFGARGARIVSVSPGSIDTPMGRLEQDHGAGQMLRFAALKRFGRVEEIAEVLAFCASNKAGYLTGTDILCDGGVVAGVRLKDLLSVGR
ncbi:MAG: SDR family oxidoreductase [Frankiaceae bacterium]|nr:SDR family oxidoreductase [Frankiaceae bacterium]